MKTQMRNEGQVDHRHPVSASFGRTVTLVDNLDKPIVMPETQRVSYFNQPVKYVSAMSLLVCMDGMMRVDIGSQEYTMRRGDLMLLGSGIICDIREVSPESRFCTLVFKEDFCRAFTEHLSIPFFQKVFAARPICAVPEEVAEGYVVIYRMIKQEVERAGESPLRMEVVRNLLQGLLFSVCDHYLARADEPGEANHKLGRKEDLYNRFVELVRRDFTRERNIGYYAERLCVTPRYLSQVVCQQSGYLAGEYINRLVIMEAQQLVQSGQYSIGQISQMLHFTSVSFFSRYFKKLTGYSPKEYQKIVG